MLFDSHAHLTHPSFDGDREEVVKKLHDSDIKIITVGADMEESERAIGLAEKHPDQIWATVGLHPHEAAKSIDWVKLKNLAITKKVVAIGECGLDYNGIMNDESRIKKLQKKIFIEQIELAKELKKPLIIHCRPTVGTMDAYEDALDILNSQFNIHNSIAGVAHFFSGSKEIAKKFLDLGFYISFAGPITFRPKDGVSPYKEIVEYISRDKILAETDSPFAAPRPWRGKRNEPVFVEFVVRQIAQWKGADFEETARQITENAKNLFKLL